VIYPLPHCGVYCEFVVCSNTYTLHMHEFNMLHQHFAFLELQSIFLTLNFFALISLGDGSETDPSYKSD
jgi:hypothetical protein